MLVVCSNSAVLAKYGPRAGAQILDAVAALGTVIDVPNTATDTQIREVIEQRDPGRGLPVCLIGGYDLLPPFILDNPTRKAVKDVDHDVPTDSPYGARPGSRAELFLPTRAVSRLPDSGVPDATLFVRLLQRAAAAPVTPTLAGTFEQAAAEFEGSTQLVHGAMPGQSAPQFSPPDVHGASAIANLLVGCGRVHVLLHGTDRHPGREKLWGRAAGSASFVDAMHVSDVAACDLRGAIVSFSTCYSAMLDSLPGDPARSPDDQVALACLAAGAKTVFGVTRANWIDITHPFDAFGAALVAKTWEFLKAGSNAAEALRQAKWAYGRRALGSDYWTRPYVLKTLLQAQCYGSPLAKLL